jgi:hypothetical protein
MNIIEKEIIRAQCYYNFYNVILNSFKKYFDIDRMKEFKEYNGFYTKIRAIIIRWIFILVMVRTSEDDPVFITQKSKDLETQVYIDINNFFLRYVENNKMSKDVIVEFSNALIEIIYTSFIEYKNIISTTKPQNDLSVIYKEKTLIYRSSSVLYLVNDKYISIFKNTISMIYYSDTAYLDKTKYNINHVFASYFRYKYLFADNQTLAYSYDKDKYSGIECFSTPFNHYHHYFCSAFPDLELALGSQGEFFDIMNKAINNKYQFPTNDLKINPIFDEIVDLRVSETTLRLLDTNKKYTIHLILPYWDSFKALDLLLESKYYYKKEIYKKGDLGFTNFFTGQSINPCDIIIVYLKN